MNACWVMMIRFLGNSNPWVMGRQKHQTNGLWHWQEKAFMGSSWQYGYALRGITWHHYDIRTTTVYWLVSLANARASSGASCAVTGGCVNRVSWNCGNNYGCGLTVNHMVCMLEVPGILGWIILSSTCWQRSYTTCGSRKVPSFRWTKGQVW